MQKRRESRLLSNQIITLSRIAEAVEAQRGKEKTMWAVESFRVQKYIREACGEFVPVWADGPTLELAVQSYDVYLEAPDGPKQPALCIQKTYDDWDGFCHVLTRLEDDSGVLDDKIRQELWKQQRARLADGRMVKMECMISGHIWQMKYAPINLNPKEDFRYRDGELPFAMESFIVVRYDYRRELGVVVRAESSWDGMDSMLEADNLKLDEEGRMHIMKR